jgi:NitT/TauT family transport system substrate-binding protein
MQALIQGWTEALDPENKEKAIEIVLKYNRETPEEIVRRQLPATRILMLPTAQFEFGRIDVAAWKQTEQIMLTQNLIDNPVHIESRLKPMVE